MFDGIIDTLSTTFTIAIIVIVVCVLVGIAKGISASEEQAERKQREEEEKKNLINTVISQSKQFPTDVLISQRDEVHRAYNELLACKRTGSFKIKEMVWIRIGDKFGCGMDLNTCYTILQHLNSEIKRRSEKR